MKIAYLFFFLSLLIPGCNKQTTDNTNVINPSESETVDVSGLSFIYDLHEHNVIDDHFGRMAKKIVPSTTYEMLVFETLRCEAWKAEMLNCYKVLKSKSSMIKIRELLDLERDSYVKHIEQKSKIEIYYGTEVFNGKSDMPGSQSDVDTVCILSDGYKDKTIELMGSMKKIGIKPIFVFDSNKFSVKIIKEHLK